jgi:uncharacterized RDD family membrane protein YckC
MSWHYAENNASRGPIPDAEFESLVRAGRVRPTTLVWREGMTDWRPLSEVAPALLAATDLPPPATEAPPLDAGEVLCAECGRRFPREATIALAGSLVCAGCKPVFLQKLKEGALPAPGMGPGAVHYAGFWIRFAAKFLDGLIMSVVLIPLYLPFIIAVVRDPGSNGSPMMLFFQLLLSVGQIALSLAFNTFFIGKYGATPGKMVCGIKVVAPDGSQINYARSLGRAAAEILSGMICDIGYIIVAFDSEKRALHDHIATTRVIYGPKF